VLIIFNSQLQQRTKLNKWESSCFLLPIPVDLKLYWKSIVYAKITGHQNLGFKKIQIIYFRIPNYSKVAIPTLIQSLGL